MAKSECPGFSLSGSKPISGFSTANDDGSDFQFSSGSSAVNSGSSYQRVRLKRKRSKPNCKSPSGAYDSPGFVGKVNDNSTGEVHFPLAPFEEVVVQSKVATEATNQEPVNNSLIKISRILKGSPQYPHFYQLRNHSELSRKILVSAWDRIFEETVEQIHSLRVDDYWVRAKELWKTMEHLQTTVYNVISLRKRLLELRDVMTELKASESEVKGLKIKAENHRLERSRLLFVILNLQEMTQREYEGMATALRQAAEMEKELPKYDDILAILARKPL